VGAKRALAHDKSKESIIRLSDQLHNILERTKGRTQRNRKNIGRGKKQLSKWGA